MKIAFNPSNSSKNVLDLIKNNKDIIFDLKGHSIYARGVEFKGTDTWRPVVDNLTNNSATSSLSANQGRVLAGLINGKSDSDHNHDDRYLKLTGGTLTGNLIGTSAMFSGRFYGNGDDEGIIIKPSSNGYAGLILGAHDGERSIFYFVKNKPFWRYSHGSDNLDIIHPKKSGTIALTSDIPSSVKNPYSLTTFGVVYDGSAEKVVSPSNFISQLEEGTSVVTDGTMFVTSWASDKGFAYTNAVNVPYKRKAARLWDYIKTKTDTLYSALGHNHDNKYLRWFGNAGQSNMNAIGRISHSSGMTDLGDPGNTTDNPMEGNIKSTSWHLYWQTNYTDNPGGSNAWVAQIVNRAGTDRWWVRSRSGGTITNGTGWTSNWRFLVTAPTSGLGNGNQPVYINSAGEVVAANSYPTSLKSPHSLTLKANGTTLAIYDGSSAKEANFTYANVGAASASHTHSYYAVNENYGGFKKAERLPTSGFYQSVESESGGNAPWKSWMHLINCQHSNTNNNYALQIAASFYDNNTFKIRVTNGSVNNAWRDIIHSGNISSQSVASASKLQTARNIWGQSFDGTADVDNTLRIRHTTGNYCEGIRIQTSDGAWSTIILGATANSGTNTNAWSIHRKSDNNFAISRNSSDGANGLVMTPTGMGLGTTAPTQRLDVAGNIRTTGNLYISHATNNNMNHDTSNPKIVFSESGSQAVGLVYTDYDSYRPSKGLKVMDTDNVDTSNVWFEVQGYNYSSGYVKNGSNDNYVLLGGGGHKAESSLRVAYASNAYHLRINSANTWSTWYWAGQSGQPSWLWGSNDGTNMYVWNPSNFRVAYAASAGNAETLGGFPKNYGQAPFGTIPCIGNDGVMEVGKYIDFHNDNSGKHDFSTRLQTTGNYANVINLPSASGTLALTSNIPNKDSWNYDDRYVRAFGTSNDNIDSDWGQSFKTFDPIPSGTPPEQNSNISILNIGENFSRRKQLAFTWSNDNIYYRRRIGGTGFTNWVRLALINDVNNYYWANVKISASSSTTTSPTVHTLTATRVCAGHDPGIDNSISCSNWFRSSGNTGWYNTTYRGGWYMSDTSWIRTHNNVGIHTSQIYADSSIRMSSIRLERTNEINSSDDLFINYGSSTNVSLCNGGGNVGIGTISPTQKLDVNGNIITKGFGIQPYYLSKSVLLPTISPGDGYKYKCLEIGRTTEISCIIADKAGLMNERGILIKFNKGYDGQIILLKDLQNYGSGNGYFWVMPSGCNIIKADGSSILVVQNQISNIYDDGHSRFLVYSSLHNVWIEFLCS